MMCRGLTVQHINLFSQLDRQVEPSFSANHQLKALVVWVAVLLLSYFALLFSSGGLEDELALARKEQQSVIAQRDALKAQIIKLQQDKNLASEIAALEQGVIFRREMLASIDPDEDAKAKDFSEHLSGLARQHINGLWFTHIQLHKNGRQIVLQGRTQQPEFLPRFLKKLSNEPVFAGQSFKVLKMNVPEKWQGALNFEVRSLAVEAKQ